MMILLFLIKESFIYAINSLIVNKLRTVLSLLGITIGIFAIISVFTVIDSLEDNIRESISTLGDNVAYVDKWPWEFSSDFKWWEYIKRPNPKLEESEQIMKLSQKAFASAFIINFTKTVQYEDNYSDEINIVSASAGYEDIVTFEIVSGRYFTIFESESSKNLAVIGYEVAKTLFIGVNPIGEEFKIDGKKYTVIGIFEKEGEDMFEMSHDNEIHIPINSAKTIVEIDDNNPSIMVEAKEGITVEELIDELQGIMRSIRRLKPLEDDDFSLNKASLIAEGFKAIFNIIDLAGIIIGGFSILVGGFGIANIMFVSVKEQTKLIGIQKAIGAKRFFILLQFLFEAVILSLIGGILGLILIFLLTLLVNGISDFHLTLSIKNIMSGIYISVVIGIISGIIPAIKASKLNPVEAINTI
jgi:putative ABC transport system permease protein